MKKIIAVAASLLLSAAVFAEGITVGARGVIGVNLGTTLEDDLDVDGPTISPLGLTAFGKFQLPVLDGKLAVQPEVGFSHVSTDAKVESVSFSTSYNAIDIPVLVVYDFDINDKLTVSPELGPKISIPVGDFDFDGVDVSIDSDVLFGIEFGVGASYKVGPGAVVADLRYDLGLTKLKLEDDLSFGTPRALVFSVGYGISL